MQEAAVTRGLPTSSQGPYDSLQPGALTVGRRRDGKARSPRGSLSKASRVAHLPTAAPACPLPASWHLLLPQAEDSLGGAPPGKDQHSASLPFPQPSETTSVSGAVENVRTREHGPHGSRAHGAQRGHDSIHSAEQARVACRVAAERGPLCHAALGESLTHAHPGHFSGGGLPVPPARLPFLRRTGHPKA